jgi:hypothetical protein
MDFLGILQGTKQFYKDAIANQWFAHFGMAYFFTDVLFYANVYFLTIIMTTLSLIFLKEFYDVIKSDFATGFSIPDLFFGFCGFLLAFALNFEYSKYFIN